MFLGEIKIETCESDLPQILDNYELLACLESQGRNGWLCVALFSMYMVSINIYIHGTSCMQYTDITITFPRILPSYLFLNSLSAIFYLFLLLISNLKARPIWENQSWIILK